MAKSFPKGYFNSLDEYETYCRCTRKIDIGDTVYIYCNPNRNDASLYKTSLIKEAIVIAKSNEGFILGMKNNSAGFWPTKDNKYYFENSRLIENIKDYPFGWAVRDYRDARIAKIIKNS
jgi:hypothetical protein